MLLRSFLAVAMMVVMASAASADRRVALVIGNSNYTATVKLPNTRNDAEAMSGLLNSQGFRVTTGIDLTRQGIAEKLGEFQRNAVDADVAIFFYAGHAMQIAGRNLIMPIEATPRSEMDAELQSVDVESVIQKTMSTAKVKIVLLDACRDNPFVNDLRRSMGATRSAAVGSGLAEMKPGEGALIAFATGPGQTALDGNSRNSPFTRALIAHIATPDLEIRHAMTRVRAQVQEETNRQQLPWENTNMTGFVYLGKKSEGGSMTTAALPAPAAATASTAGIATPDTKTFDLQMWQSAEGLKTAEGYEAYLSRFPAGDFAPMARAKLAALSQTRSVGAGSAGNADLASAGPATQADEDALGLDRDAWRNVQQKLAHAGQDVKVDGKVGDGTRDAIRDWQSSQKAPSTGYLNKPQYEALLRVPPPAQQAAKSEDDEPKKKKSVTRSAAQEDEPRPTRRRSQSSGGVDASQALGAALAIGGGIAIGRALSRR